MGSPDAELARLLDALASYFRDVHAGWENPDEPEVLALWVVHTWFIRAYDFTKVCTVYLWITSHDPDCGKSTFAYALKLVCPGAVIAAPTVAAITRFLSEPANPNLIIEQHRVLIIDQFHNLGRSKSIDQQNLYSALANGHAPGTDAMITGKDGNIEFHSSFYPKVFVGLDTYRPDEDIVTRCIRLRFRPCTDTEQTELAQSQALRPLKQSGKQIALSINTWANDDRSDHGKALDAAMLDDRTRTLNDGSHLTRRESDNFRMLFALADMAGGEYPELIRNAAERMTSGSLSPDPDETEADRIDIAILNLTRQCRLPVENWLDPNKPPLNPEVPASGFMLRNTDLGWPRPRFNARDGLPTVTLIVNLNDRKAGLRIISNNQSLSQLCSALETGRKDLIGAYKAANRLKLAKDGRPDISMSFRHMEPAQKIIEIDFTKVIFGK